IPDTFGIFHLLTSGLRAVVARIPHPDDQLLFASAFQQLADVKSERIVSALMFASFLSVHEYLGMPVDGAEMQQYFLSAHGTRHRKAGLVPEGLVLPYTFPYP